MSYVHPFWLTPEARNYFTPPDERFPEGPQGVEILKQIVSDSTVLDFGCGDGRLAKCFSPSQYHGFDANPSHVDLAKINNPHHRFDTRFEPAEIILCWNVLMHVPDEELSGLIEQFNDCTVVIAEVMNPRWRRTGDPPVFNRDRKDYTALFDKRETYHKLWVNRYRDWLTILVLDDPRNRHPR